MEFEPPTVEEQLFEQVGQQTPSKAKRQQKKKQTPKEKVPEIQQIAEPEPQEAVAKKLPPKPKAPPKPGQKPKEDPCSPKVFISEDVIRRTFIPFIKSEIEKDRREQKKIGSAAAKATK